MFHMNRRPDKAAPTRPWRRPTRVMIHVKRGRACLGLAEYYAEPQISESGLWPRDELSRGGPM